ncbi:hypothetical protein BZA05DRAFT_400970 [Tricharina praecox]|uniref:uncharacterized protein n=1 Tax=Tricharina praecox TaxID=43433 RepID=UPI00221FC45A|nr:uncharacterized protein BZA05DRAFT_400970 [Tricharina praecox]KAI5850101.1 hypothetical protein BZA05DRAFT_400970 [Tricharina praecox]
MGGWGWMGRWGVIRSAFVLFCVVVFLPVFYEAVLSTYYVQFEVAVRLSVYAAAAIACLTCGFGSNNVVPTFACTCPTINLIAFVPTELFLAAILLTSPTTVPTSFSATKLPSPPAPTAYLYPPSTAPLMYTSRVRS